MQFLEFEHIFFLLLRTQASCVEKCAVFPNVSRRESLFGEGSRKIFRSERSAARGNHGELCVRGRGLASETGAKYGKTGDFRVAERATSRAQLFLGMEIIGTRRERIPRQIRFWRVPNADLGNFVRVPSREKVSKFDRNC